MILSRDTKTLCIMAKIIEIQNAILKSVEGKKYNLSPSLKKIVKVKRGQKKNI